MARPARSRALSLSACPVALEKSHPVDRHVGLAFGADPAGELRTTADGSPLVIQLAGRHVPALVDFADDGIVAEFEVVEEFLAELHRTVHLFDPPQGDARAVDRHQEHRQALVLGHVPVGSGQHQPVVGRESACAPGLRAVDDPFVAGPVGAGDHACQIGSAAWLRQQLHQHLITAKGAGDVLLLLLFAAGVEDGGGTDRERRRVQDDGHFVGLGLFVECPLILDGQTKAAVLAREADAGESAVVQLLLEFASAQPGRFLAAV